MPTPQQWEGSYTYKQAYFSFHPWGVGIISLPISRREIDGYEVPFTYTKFFLQVLYDLLLIVKRSTLKTKAE
jgi:hypothetical protein